MLPVFRLLVRLLMALVARMALVVLVVPCWPLLLIFHLAGI